MFLRSRRFLTTFLAAAACTLAIFSHSLLLLIRDGLCGTLSGTRVGLGPLASYGQTLSVSDSAVAVDLDHALDVESDVTAEVTFNVVPFVNSPLLVSWLWLSC